VVYSADYHLFYFFNAKITLVQTGVNAIMSKSIQTVTIDLKLPELASSNMEIFWFRPKGPGLHLALILAQHIPVGHTSLENDKFILVTARRFAVAGYVVAVPFIFCNFC
jgi:hypothetical protein